MAETVGQHVIRVLRGDPASRIRFSFPTASGTLTLTAQNFRGVAHAIERGQVEVVVTDTISPDAAATYDPDPGGSLHGRINIRPQYLGRKAKADIMHECTMPYSISKTPPSPRSTMKRPPMSSRRALQPHERARAIALRFADPRRRARRRHRPHHRLSARRDRRAGGEPRDLASRARHHSHPSRLYRRTDGFERLLHAQRLAIEASQNSFSTKA